MRVSAVKRCHASAATHGRAGHFAVAGILAIRHKLGDATVFGRLMIDLIAREHLAGEDHTRTLSPMFELGVMPFGRGACLSAAAAWDVRIDEPDQAIIGAFFGWCSLVK
jgi:hypothetical protein